MGSKRLGTREEPIMGKPFGEETLPASARRARVRPNPRVHRAPPPPLSASRLPSARAPSPQASGGGDVVSAASPVASFSLTGETGGGGTFGG